jgi:hypothetical protein
LEKEGCFGCFVDVYDAFEWEHLESFDVQMSENTEGVSFLKVTMPTPLDFSNRA